MKYFCFSLIAGSAIYFILGLTTYLWPTANGEVVLSASNRVPVHGSPPPPMAGGLPVITVEGGKTGRTWHKLTYTYKVKGKIYKSSFIAFRLPINLKLPNETEQIEIHYLPFFHNISVAKAGPDTWVCLFILMFSGGLLYLQHSFLKRKNA